MLMKRLSLRSGVGAMRVLLLVCLIALWGAATAVAEEPQPAEIQAQALRWIDQYRRVQVLFHDDDLAKLREQLAADSPAQAAQWWRQTEPLRAALESPEWAETREWFREFLRVQAVLSDEQIEELRSDAKQAVRERKPQDFQAVLNRIEQYRSQLVRGAASDRELREEKLRVLEAYRQREVIQRTESAKAAAFSTNRLPAPDIRRDSRYRAGPLIDSLDIARWTILRAVWGF